MDMFYYIKFLSAFVFVIALMLLLGWAARRFTNAQGGMMGTPPTDRRLNVVEQRMIDQKHRLVLIKRDDVEHLLLVGAEHDLLIETNIKSKVKKTVSAQAKPPPKTKRKSTK